MVRRTEKGVRRTEKWVQRTEIVLWGHRSYCAFPLRKSQQILLWEGYIVQLPIQIIGDWVDR